MNPVHHQSTTPADIASREDAALSPALDASPTRRFYEDHERAILGSAGVLLVLVAWELVPALGLGNPLFMSSPSRVAMAATEYVGSPDFLTDIKMSATEFAVGLGAAIVLAIPLGLAMGWYRRLEYFLDYVISFAYAAPRVALMPLLIIWFGIGIQSKIALIFMMSFFPILITTIVGVKTVDDALLQVARAFNANDRQIFRTVILPASVPAVISGIRLGLGLALIGVVVGEFVASSAGIGHRIQAASTFFQTDLVFVGLFIIAGSGVVLTELLRRLERRFDAWRPDR